MVLLYQHLMIYHLLLLHVASRLLQVALASIVFVIWRTLPVHICALNTTLVGVLLYVKADS